MRLVGILVAGLIAVLIVFLAIIYAASESGEVVTLHTRDADGTMHATRVWLVDHDGAEWVRTGHPEKGWYRRLLADPHVRLERAGTTTDRIAVPEHDPAVTAVVNGAFVAKYGAADWIVALSGDATKRVPVRLDPVAPGPAARD